MKKLLILAATAVGATWARKKMDQQRTHQEAWGQATDTTPKQTGEASLPQPIDPNAN
ncbi:DLW-39 family protein [Actinomycetota bacterium]